MKRKWIKKQRKRDNFNRVYKQSLLQINLILLTMVMLMGLFTYLKAKQNYNLKHQNEILTEKVKRLEQAHTILGGN